MKTQRQRREYLIEHLLRERGETFTAPQGDDEQRYLLRGLLNVRTADPASDEFLRIQDEYLRTRLEERGVASLDEVTWVDEGIGIWQGDITLLEADAIVNAANSGLTGCWHPNHVCIDNCIHTFAGVQLRLECDRIMRRQGRPEPTGQAKITPAYNLPSKYVIHTVGPIVRTVLAAEDGRLLASSYRSCLELARENGLESIAFCCVSTGVFGFPNEPAARIAVEEVRHFLEEAGSGMKVVFNVFKDVDREIYERLLG